MEEASEYLMPSQIGFTLYTENGCYACKQIEKYLNDNNINFKKIDCSIYFKNDLTPLINFIHSYIENYVEYHVKNKNTIIFPIIFYNGNFIGYFNSQAEYFDCINNFNIGN